MIAIKMDWAQQLIGKINAAKIVDDAATAKFCENYSAGDSVAAWEAYRASAKSVVEVGREYHALVFCDGSVYADWKRGIYCFYSTVEDLASEEEGSDVELAASLRKA